MVAVPPEQGPEHLERDVHRAGAEHLLHLRARVELVMAKMHKAQMAYFNKMSDVYRLFKD